MSKHCPNCGIEQPDEAKFCESCGSQMDNGAGSGGQQMYEANQFQGGGSNMGIEKRDVVKAIIFSFITCGIYAIYWMMKITDEVNELSGEQNTTTGGMAVVFTFITFGIYCVYWMYKMGEGINKAQQKRNMHVEGNAGILYLVLSLFGLAIVSYALMQGSINKIIDFDNGNA